MSYKTFKDWRDDHLSLDNDGMVCHKIKAPYKHKEYLAPVCFDQFEDLWDFWEEKTDKTKDLILELGEEMLTPLTNMLAMHQGATDKESVELCNKIARIRRILKVLECKDYQ